MMNLSEGIFSTIFLAFAVAVYFLPTLVSSLRKHHNANAIFVTNLLLGWTAIGWIASLIWSSTAVRRTEEPIELEVGKDTRACPFCAEEIKKEAKICRFCRSEVNPE